MDSVPIQAVRPPRPRNVAPFLHVVWVRGSYAVCLFKLCGPLRPRNVAPFVIVALVRGSCTGCLFEPSDS